MSQKSRAWLSAIRLRTLPLAFATPLIGSSLAAYKEKFDWRVFVLATLTTLFLQILSNLANDYGDGIKGTDGESRIGPSRVVQSGRVSRGEMKLAILLVAIVCLVSGVLLLIIGTRGMNISGFLWFLVLGLAAIVSSLKYTMGKTPFGYLGFGDLFVFFWFGLVGVCGTYFLHAKELSINLLMPAASLGLLSAGVLNINNMRDWEGDKKSGKKTLVVLMGLKNAKIYHVLLVITAIILGVVYTFINFQSPYQYLFLLVIPFMLLNMINTIKIKEPFKLDPFLKKLAVLTFFYAVSFSGGYILAHYA